MTQYDAILFDSDGVLVTPPARDTQAAATLAAFSEVGVSNVSERHIDEIVADAPIERVREICTSYEVDLETFWDEWERQDERSQVEKFKSGARTCYDDISVIEDILQPCGIVSNNHHTTIEFVLEFFELHGQFETFYGREKTVESLDLQKPNTHYLERALTDLGAESALYVGDSESDIIAADNAGIESAFVRRPHSKTTELTLSPTYEIDTLRDLASMCCAENDPPSGDPSHSTTR